MSLLREQIPSAKIEPRIRTERPEIPKFLLGNDMHLKRGYSVPLLGARKILCRASTSWGGKPAGLADQVLPDREGRVGLVGLPGHPVPVATADDEVSAVQPGQFVMESPGAEVPPPGGFPEGEPAVRRIEQEPQDHLPGLAEQHIGGIPRG